MFITAILLSLSCSIDALGIGIIYGLKNTKFPLKSKLILFSFAFVSGLLSVYLGSYLKIFLSDLVSKILSSSLLVILGVSIIIKSIKNMNNPESSYDKNYNNSIDLKETVILSLAISIDLACVGISGGIMGITSIYFPILMASFHLIFVILGIFVGSKINTLIKIPDYTWSIISACFIILIGIPKFFM